MSERFDHVQQLYQTSLKQHGDTPAALMTPKGRNNLRYRAILPFLDGETTSVLDYGCGLGYLKNFLEESEHSVAYTGVDFLSDFVETCRAKFTDSSTFKCIGPRDQIPGQHDVVFASGVFNLKTDDDSETSKRYAFSRLKDLFSATKEVMVCDFLSVFVDFQQSDAQHFSVGEISEFCCQHLSRRFQVRHDLLPYEFTLIVWKDDKIQRPQNTFELDA